MADDGRRITPFGDNFGQLGNTPRKPRHVEPRLRHRNGPGAGLPMTASHVLVEPGKRLNHRQARRISAVFASVGGVEVSPTRLCDVAAGAPVTGVEYTDIAFAVIAVDIQRTQPRPRTTLRPTAQRVAVAAMAVVSLAAMFTMLIMFISLAAHGP